MVKSFTTKEIGYYTLNADSILDENIIEIKNFIKIIYLKKGSEILLDFNAHQCKNNSLFFISPSQFFQFPENKLAEGIILYFNRDFYCVEIHDKEVSCDGILYNLVDFMISFFNKSLSISSNPVSSFSNSISISSIIFSIDFISSGGKVSSATLKMLLYKIPSQETSLS